MAKFEGPCSKKWQNLKNKILGIITFLKEVLYRRVKISDFCFRLFPCISEYQSGDKMKVLQSLVLNHYYALKMLF